MILDLRELHTASQRVPCPWCRAPIGQVCVNQASQPVGQPCRIPHADRIRDAAHAGDVR